MNPATYWRPHSSAPASRGHQRGRHQRPVATGQPHRPAAPVPDRSATAPRRHRRPAAHGRCTSGCGPPPRPTSGSCAPAARPRPAACSRNSRSATARERVCHSAGARPVVASSVVPAQDQQVVHERRAGCGARAAGRTTRARRGSTPGRCRDPLRLDHERAPRQVGQAGRCGHDQAARPGRSRCRRPGAARSGTAARPRTPRTACCPCPRTGAPSWPGSRWPGPR